MNLPKDDAAILSARWSEGVLLKRDVFSSVERGRFRADDGEVDGVLRRLDQVPFWSFAVALHLFSRERRALTLARDLDVGPKLLWAGRRALVRGFIDGAALHLAKPHGDVAYFRSAKVALRKLHRAGICHNDLAKEQNWLVGRDGRAYLTDFQLAACFKTRSRLFRIAAYEDLRHLLKHKRSYAPEALTPKERKVLARKSAVASIWLKTGKKVYQAITRGIFNFTDREGGGRRLVNDAPVLIDLIRRNPLVRDTAIVAFADRRVGVALYAFVEADQSALEKTLRSVIAQRSEMSAFELQIQNRRRESNEISQDQQRLRENMKALKGTAEEKALTQRYASQLNQQEDRLAVVRKEISDLEVQRDKSREKLSQMIEDISMDVIM